MHNKNIISTGQPIENAENVLIMIHGRGGSAEDILSLSAHLKVKDYAVVAPKATGNSWYPYSFLADRSQNEPGLSSALAVITEVVDDLIAQGKRTDNIYFLGFSQGACLMLDFLARNPKRYGGAVAFSGGLIGKVIDENEYTGDLGGTPVFIGSSDPDSHIPVERVHQSTAVLKALNARVTERIYPGLGHTISQDEINLANELVFSNAVGRS